MSGGSPTGTRAREAEPGSASAPERDRRPGRRRCSTCGARRRPPGAAEEGNVTCRRCGSDLGLLVALEREADRRYGQALEAYRQGHFRTAASRAAECAALEARPESLRLLAAAALRAGDFLTALRAARLARATGWEGEAPAEPA